MAVSGGLDSTALLHLLHHRTVAEPGLELVAIHIDHELRGPASRKDAAFVAGLAGQLGLPLVSVRRTEAQPYNNPAPGKNLAASLRRLRLHVYRDAVARFALQGVVLGQHRDDVIETLLIRLLRGSSRSGLLGLTPLAPSSCVGGVLLRRPLLGIPKSSLRRYLRWTGRPWREDASNVVAISLRNRLRAFLATRPALAASALAVWRSAQPAERAIRAATPRLQDKPAPADWPASRLLAHRAGREWLTRHGVPQDEAGPDAVSRLLHLVDAAGPRAAEFAGGVRVERRRGRLAVQPPPGSAEGVAAASS